MHVLARKYVLAGAIYVAMVKLSQLVEEKFGDEQGNKVDFSGLSGKLPSYVSLDQIEVDVESILEICRLTRINSLTVLGFEEKGEDKFDIKGIDRGGGAVGMVNTSLPPDKIKIGPLAGVLKEVSWKPTLARSLDFRYANISVNLNNAGNPQKLRDPGGWARLLDASLKKQLKKMASSRLGFDREMFINETITPIVVLGFYIRHTIKNLSLHAGIMSAFILYLLGTAFKTGNLGWLYLALISVNKITSAMSSQMMMESLPPNIKESAATPFTFGDWEYDRLIRVWHILRTKTLVGNVMED